MMVQYYPPRHNVTCYESLSASDFETKYNAYKNLIHSMGFNNIDENEILAVINSTRIAAIKDHTSAISYMGTKKIHSAGEKRYYDYLRDHEDLIEWLDITYEQFESVSPSICSRYRKLANQHIPTLYH